MSVCVCVCVCVCVYEQNLTLKVFIISYLPDPSARAGYDTRSIFK